MKGSKFMLSARFVLAATLGTASAFALSLGVSGAQGKDNVGKAPAPGRQQATSGEHKPPVIWYKICDDVPTPKPAKPGEQPKPQKPEEMKKTNVCSTQVDLRDGTTAILVGRLAVRQMAGQPKPELLAMLPLGSAIPPGVLVKIDDKVSVKLAYMSCDQAGCYAEAAIEPALVDQMKTGKQIAYLGTDATGRARSFQLPLDDFAKAFDGAPAALDKYNEEQRKIAEIINARLAELRKRQEEATQSGQAAPTQAPAKTDKNSK
jgi:invasion protein IalB